jgi:hypothetical protein
MAPGIRNRDPDAQDPTAFPGTDKWGTSMVDWPVGNIYRHSCFNAPTKIGKPGPAGGPSYHSPDGLNLGSRSIRSFQFAVPLEAAGL